jgi:hypothetical protein
LVLSVFSGIAGISPVWAATGVDLGWLGKIELTWDF